jgi:hypothetical protein
VLFLIYVTASELNELFGQGELHKVLFKRRTSSVQATRRARIRLMTRLSRLTDEHSLEELTDRNSKPHGELVSLLRGLSDKH